MLEEWQGKKIYTRKVETRKKETETGRIPSWHSGSHTQSTLLTSLTYSRVLDSQQRGP